MSISIGIYQGRPVRVIESCIPDIEKQIVKNEYKTIDNMSIRNESYDISQKRKQYHSELGDFSTTYLHQIKYNEHSLIDNSRSAGCLSTPYEKYWFSEASK